VPDTSATTGLAQVERVEERIFVLRGLRVMLSHDLAGLYDVPTKVLVQAMRRNTERFPADFVFQLTAEEFAGLRSQLVTSNRGGARYRPYAFTEQGVAMLSSVLRNERAIAVNIEIMRTFVKLRTMLESNKALAHKLALLEEKYDAQFRDVFDAIRDLMAPPETPKEERLGFLEP
jgi:ORF6N domain